MKVFQLIIFLFFYFVQDHEIETFLIKTEEPLRTRKKHYNSNGRPRLWSEDEKFSSDVSNHKLSSEKSEFIYRGNKLYSAHYL